MTARTSLNTLLLLQGIYTLVTAIWPLLDIESFMFVTGPKTDVWLVKTVGILLIPIAFLFLLNVYRPGPFLQVAIVGVFSSIGLAGIDFYYTANNTITWVYAVDGGLQVIFACCWVYLAMKLSLPK